MANQILPYIRVEGIAEYSSKISALAKNKKIFIICDQNTLQCVKYLQSNINELSEAPIFKVGLGEKMHMTRVVVPNHPSITVPPENLVYF